MAAGYAKIKEDFDAGHLLSDSQKAQLRSLAAQNFDPNQGSARELSCASVSRLRDARSEEREGRQKVASMRRMLQDARTEAAKVELRERRWAEAAAYRATMNRDKPDLANVVRLNADEVVGMSVRFVQRMAELEPDANKRGWYNLFKHMDDDGSGSPSRTNLTLTLTMTVTLTLTLSLTLTLTLILTLARQDHLPGARRHGAHPNPNPNPSPSLSPSSNPNPNPHPEARLPEPEP